MNPAATLKTLYHLTLAPVRGATHDERLESFYRGQAKNYDAFRARMLHGRRELIESLPAEPGAVWVDLGAGTGENPERFGSRLTQFSQVYLVDLAPSLLEVTRERIAKQSWPNVVATRADATRFVPAEGSADLVTFSYSLTMIPDWFSALENAWRMLKPGGTIGVVDFYVARKHPDQQHTRHSWWTRTFWSTWFALDNVFPSPDHLPWLCNRFETVHLQESRGKMPLMPLARVPYYRFVGRKRDN